MDVEKKKKNVITVFIVFFTVVCSSLSWFFTMMGLGAKEFGMVPLLKVPTLAWSIWGIIWGGVCGAYGGHLLVKSLIKRRNILVGVTYGTGIAVIIGAVNGFLTNTIIFGVIEGLILGGIGGLIFSTVFLGKYKEN